jgi:trigger factor
MLKIEKKDLENCQVQLTIELEDDRLKGAMRSAAKRLGKKSKIAGFRPGKAPYDVLLRKFGEDYIFEEALEKLGQEAYREALEHSEIEPYASGTLDEVISREPLVLQYTIPLEPAVDLGSYRDVRIAYETPVIEDEAVDRVMEDLRQRQALIEPAERPAGLSDVVMVDIKAELLEDEDQGEKTLLNNEGVSILVDEETNWPVPGISEHLLGLEAGQEISFEYTFTDDYDNEKLRNKKASFNIACLEVKSRLVPEWTNDLAKSIGDYEDLVDLRMNVRKDLLAEAERQTESSHTQEVVNTVVEGASVSYPPILLQHELNDMLLNLTEQLRYQKLSLEDYLKVENKTYEDLVEELEPTAKERVVRALVLGKVIHAESIEVEDSEIDAEIDRIIERFEDRSDEAREIFDNPSGRNKISLDLLSNKAIERLVAIAKGEADQPTETEAEPIRASEVEGEPLDQASEIVEE